MLQAWLKSFLAPSARQCFSKSLDRQSTSARCSAITPNQKTDLTPSTGRRQRLWSRNFYTPRKKRFQLKKPSPQMTRTVTPSRLGSQKSFSETQPNILGPAQSAHSHRIARSPLNKIFPITNPRQSHGLARPSYPIRAWSKKMKSTLAVHGKI